MNRFLTVILSLLFLTALNWSCQNEQKTTEQNEPNYAKLVAQKTGEIPSECTVAGDPFQITTECATNYINAWKDGPFANKNKMGSESKYIVRGFHIKHGEFVDMINKMGNDLDVWAWLSIEEGEPALIFEVTDNTPGDAGGTNYYDFTTPCPNFCPN